MQRIISFSLDNFHSWPKTRNRNDLIDYARDLDIDGIEITFGRKKFLFEFKLSRKNKKWLEGLKHITIHAPWNILSESKNEAELIEQLDIIKKLYNEVNAQNLIIHPHNLPEPEILKRYSFFVSTENMPIKHRIDLNKMAGIIKKYPKIGLCLDVNHAYRWGKNETKKYVERFRDKITQIHLSGTYKNQEHKSLRIVTKDFMKSISSVIEKLDVPVIIEVDFTKKDIKFVKEEIKYIREIFNNN